MATRTVDLGSVIGPQGPAGPNEITSATETNLNGVLMGDGSNVAVKPVDAVPTPGSTNLVESGGVASAISVELLKSGSLNGTSSSETYSTNGHRLIILELYGNTTNTLWYAIPAARFASTYGTVVGFQFDIGGSSSINVRGSISINATSISVSNFTSSAWSSVAFRIWGVL